MKVLSLLALASCAAAVGMKPSPTPDKPEAFQWRYPFRDEDMAGWTRACEATQKFEAREFTLHELMDPFPRGLGPWATGLKELFAERQYPGGWGGWDKHLHDRTIVYMEFKDVPVKVREWIGGQEREGGEGKGLYAVFKKPVGKEEVAGTVGVGEGEDADKVIIFAPGALYEVLPLWVAEGSECEGELCPLLFLLPPFRSIGYSSRSILLTPSADTLLDLSKYQPAHAEGGVVAWPSKTRPGAGKAINIEITANQLGEKVAGSPVEGGEAKAEGTGKEEL